MKSYVVAHFCDSTIFIWKTMLGGIFHEFLGVFL